MIKPSTEAENEFIHQRLKGYNRQFWHCLREYNFHMEENDEIAAGIVAGSTFETLEIEFLFVEEKYRGKGYGHRLLCYTEEKAKSDGIKHALLNTYSFQAPGFYIKEGYRELFRIEKALGEFTQHFFWKDL